MSISQNRTRLSPNKPPRKVEFTSQIKPYWFTGHRGDLLKRTKVRILCKATFGPGRYSRFVWWEGSFKYELGAQRAAEQTLMAAEALFGGAR
jgi:hypothetical protein